MAINIKFDLANNPEPPTIVLAKRNGDKLGQLKVDPESIELNDKFNDASEISFTLNKYIDGEITNLWDDVVDFKLIHCKEWDMWFEITVELDEETETVKTVFCKQLGQAELSQIMIYNLTINQEGDSNWDVEKEEYKKTILYSPNNTNVSLLHRLLKDKAPHYSIEHVDSTIANIQRMFSFDGVSIYDAFMEIAEEIGCLFVFNSNSDENGKIQRTISVYDLQQNCENPDCKHRGEFIDVCPKCGGTDIDYNESIFKDTTIFVTADELASGGIQLTTDTDSVKNCFKLEAGDDLITATIRNCNPNGTDYIWYFSDDMKSDMSEELKNKINSYDAIYNEYYNNHISNIDTTILNKYNALVEKYNSRYCLDCGYEGHFKDTCPECDSTNIKLQSIPTTIRGYSALMNAYYNAIDLGLYLESGLMPSVEIAETSAEEQAALLTTSTLSPVAVTDIKTVSKTTADSAVLAMAKIIVKSTFKVEIKDNSSSLSDDKKTWTGKFIVANYSDEEDTAESQEISVSINDDLETFTQQKIDKALNKDNTENLSVSGLFAIKELDAFKAELKKYALNPLTSFYDACNACITILTEQGAGNEDEKKDLYDNLYTPYLNKLRAIEAEVQVRENEIAVIEGVYTKDNDGNETLTTKGIQHYINECKDTIQSTLNFENYIGDDLWIEFCSYRREDKYSNDNYISDGLNNAELFNKAKEFIEVAENEIYKSAELQHSISTTLKNLLAIEKFRPLVENFSVGNWMRVQIDDEVYKLRLLDYNISYGGFESISVTFSDVTKIKTGITDVQNILSQASSMATSYSSVQKQASQGETVKGTVDQWLSNGLNSAQVRIQNNITEDIVLDKNGLLCRSYDDVTGTYNPEQFRITHNMMAYTSDNWKTVSAALGKHDYVYFDDNDVKQNGVDYGLSAKFVTAGIVNGSQIIGGDIYSSNYPKTINEETGEEYMSGSYLNLTDGSFDFAGGKIVYDSEDNSLTLKGVTIEWSDANKAEIKDITGLEEYLGLVEESKRIATNYMSFNNDYGDGLTIGNLEDSTVATLGRNAYIDSLGFHVRNGKDTMLASFGETATIGKIDSNNVYIDNDSIDIRRGSGDNAIILASFEDNDIYLGSESHEATIHLTGNGTTFSSRILEIEGYGDKILQYDDALLHTDGSLTLSGYDRIDIVHPYGGLVFDVNRHGFELYTSYDNDREMNGIPYTVRKNFYMDSSNLIYKYFDYDNEDYNMGEINWDNGNLSFNCSKLDSSGDVDDSVGAGMNIHWSGVSLYASEGYNVDVYADSLLVWGKIIADSYNDVDGRILCYVDEYGRVILGSQSNSAASEIRSPSNIYLKCGGITGDETGRTLIWNFTDSDNVYLRTGRTNVANVGNPSYKWKNIYATNGTIETSDRNQKQDIQKIEDKYLEMFDLLEPVSFKRIDGDRTHIGFVSQDVESAMNQVGLNAVDFAGFCKDIKETTDENGELSIVSDENGSPVEIYGLRYSEFIALNTAKIKQLEQLVLQLQDEINELKSN